METPINNVNPTVINAEYIKIKNEDGQIPALKYLYKAVNKQIIASKYESVVELVNYFADEHNDDIPTLRMLLDVIKKVSDEPIIQPLMLVLVNMIESKLGKKIY